MTLKLTVDKLDGLPEAVHSFYEPTENGFRLKVDGVEDVSGLKSALQKEREAAKAYKSTGLSPDEIAELKALRDRTTEEAARKAGDFDKLRDKMASQFETEKAALKAELEAIAKSEADARINQGLMSALAEAGATAEGMSLLPTVFKNRAKIETVDGVRVLRVLDEDGTPMLISGKDATLADLVKVAQSKYGSLFKATTKAGSGTPTASNGAGGAVKTVNRSTFDAMSQAQRAAFVREGGKVAS